MCKYESLIDGSLGLVDVAIMNEALDCEAENKYRVTQWMNRNDGNRT